MFQRLSTRVFSASILVASLALAACNNGSDESNAAGNSPALPLPPTSNTAPQIGGTPAMTATVGVSYIFRPMAADADGDPLLFEIDNAPGWLSINATSGLVTGTPQSGDVGTFGNIVIAVSDGMAEASLPAFSIIVGEPGTSSVTLTWTPPMQNTDGSQLTDLKAYKFYYGLQPNNLTNEIRVENPGLSAYVIDDLVPNTYYFGITAINANEIESDISNVASKTVVAN